MLKSAFKALLGSRHKREAKKLQPLINEINGIFEGLSSLSDDQLRGKTQEFRDRIGAATADLDAEVAKLKDKKRHSEDGRSAEVPGPAVRGAQVVSNAMRISRPGSNRW